MNRNPSVLRIAPLDRGANYTLPCQGKGWGRVLILWLVFVISLTMGISTRFNWSHITQVLALSESQKRMPQDVVFTNVGYSGINVAVGSSQIQLGKDSNWWNLNWNYKKQLTVKNLGTSQVGQNATVQVTVDTTSLGLGTTKLQTDLDDLRIVYAIGVTPTFTELPRTINQTIGQTNVVTVAFPLQANIGATTTDSSYYLYYGNPVAAGPSFPKEKGLSFDGGDKVTFNNVTGLGNSDFTASGWIKVRSQPGYYSSMVLVSASGFSLYFSQGGDGGMDLISQIYNGSTWTQVSCDVNARFNTWYYPSLVYVESTNKAQLFLNGTACSSQVTIPGGMNDTYSTTLTSGYYSSYYHDGLIDDIQIWNRALTQSEIQARMGRNLDSADPYWSNLKGYWKMDDGSGQTVTDSSSSGNNGVLGANSGVSTDDPTWFSMGNNGYNIGMKNATLVAPLNGTTTAVAAGGSAVATTATGALRYTTAGAMVFDGKNDYIDFGDVDALDFTSNYSLSAWIKPTAYGTIISKQGVTSSVGDNGYILSLDSAGRLWLWNHQTTPTPNNCHSNIHGVSTAPINQWSLVTLTFEKNTGQSNQNTVKIYFNGTLDATDANGCDQFANSTTFRVGQKWWGMGYYSGLIDELGAYEKTLSASEIAVLYNSGKPAPITPDSTTKLLLHFDENGDDSRLSGKVFDASGNNNNGTIYGAKYTDGIVPAGELSHQGVMLEEGTTNVVTNPSFENSITTGWINKITQNYGGGTTDADGNTLIGSTVVNDVFFYDTTKDSDGGAWRNNATAQASSWYNEGFSTTRGKKREFPEKSYIVADGDGVSIIDAVENKLWMRFSKGSSYLGIFSNAQNITSVSFLNGRLYTTCNLGGGFAGFREVIFTGDVVYLYDNVNRRTYNETIAQRNDESTSTYSDATGVTALKLLSYQSNDVSAVNIGGTQYVAVATDGGVSVINETAGSVANYYYSGGGTNQGTNAVQLTSVGDLYFSGSAYSPNGSIGGEYLMVYYKSGSRNINVGYTSDFVGGADKYFSVYSQHNNPHYGIDSGNGIKSFFVTEGTSTIDGTSNTIYIGTPYGMSVIQQKKGDESRGSVKYYNKDRITEEMIGDIRGMWPLYGEVGVNPTITSAAATFLNINTATNKTADLSVGNTGRPWGGSGGSNGEIQSADYERAIRGNGLKFDGVGDYLKQKVYQTEAGSTWGPVTNNFSLASGAAFFRSGESLGSEIVSNGNMEGSFTTTWVASAGVTITAVADQATGVGTSALEATYVSTNSWESKQAVNLTAGNTYKFGGWVKSLGSSNCSLELAKPDNSALYFSGNAATTWTYFQSVVTATVTGAHNVVLVNQTQGTTCRWDDISLKQVNSPNLSTYKGTDSGSTPYMLVVKDTGGSAAWGYMGANSVGETLGGELLSNTGFETAGAGGSDVFAGWTEFTVSGGTLSDETSLLHGGSHALKIATAGNWGNRETQVVAVTAGKLYKYSFWTRGDGTRAGGYQVFNNTGATDIITATTGVIGTTYQLVTGYFVAPVGCSSITFYLHGPLSGATAGVYFDDASLKEVVDTQIDGVHIMSTRNGTTRNWAGIDTGFNYNDTNYTYEVKKTDFQITNSFTTGAWVKTNDINGSIIDKYDSSKNQRSFMLTQISANTSFYISNDGVGSAHIDSTVDIKDSNWHYVVAVYSGSTIKLYVDGSDVGGTIVGTVTPNIFDSRTSLQVGTGTAAGYLIGTIDEPFITAEALTAGQISDMYQKGLAAKNSSNTQTLAGTSNIVKAVSASSDGKYVYVATGGSGGAVSVIKNGKSGDYTDSDSLINSFTTATTLGLLNNDSNALAMVGIGGTPVLAVGSTGAGVSIINGNLLTASQTITAPYFKYGSAALKLNNAINPLDSVYSIGTSLGIGTTWALSAYVYSDGATITSSDVQLYSQNQMIGTTYEDVGGGWWRMSNVLTVGTTISQNYGVQVKAGKTIYVDGVQMENWTRPTSYADGSLGTGYSWLGTANNSYSSRTRSDLNYSVANNINPGVAGTLSMWIYWDPSRLNNSSDIWYGTYSGGNSEGFFSYFYKPSSQISFTHSLNGVSLNKSISAVIPNLSTGWHLFSYGWNRVSDGNDKLYMWIDGTLKASTSSGTLDTSPTFTNIYIGGRVQNSSKSGLLYSDVRIFDQSLTDNEVTDLYNQGLTNHQNGDESATRYASSGSYISPVVDLNANGSWGTVPISFSDIGGSVAYWTRTSGDNSTWGTWVPTSGSIIVSDPRRYFQWRADLSGNQLTTPTVNGMVVSYIEDTQAPNNIGATDVTVYGGIGSTQAIMTGSWVNFDKPVFSWIGATDVPAEGQSASGVAGYHVILTKDVGATPTEGQTHGSAPTACYLFTNDADRNFKVGVNPSGCQLTNGVWYLRMQVVDNSGNISVPVTLFTYQYDGNAPSAPGSVSTTTIGYSANNTFTFYWPAVTDVGPAGLKGYEYRTGVGESDPLGQWQFTTETTVTDVPAYTEGANTFYVRAVDNAGNYSQATTNSGTASYYYNQSAPEAPQNLTISPATDDGQIHDGEQTHGSAPTNKFTVTWDKPQKYSGDIAKYYYCVNCTPAKDSMTETTSEETVLRKLTNLPLATQQGKNTLYMVAEDNNINTETGHGNVNYNAYSLVDFYAATLAPAAPTNVTISDASDRSTNKWRLTLAWDVGNTTVTVDHFDIYRSSDAATYSKVGTMTGMAFTDGSLSQSQKYYYYVKAIDNAGAVSIASAVVNLSPEGRYSEPPSAGGTPTVDVGSNTATIKWGTSRVAYGTVEYGKTSSYGSAASESATTKDHVVKLSGLSPGVEYHYRVQSLDDAGLVGYERSTAYSSDYTFTTLSAPEISDITVDEVTLTTATISWATRTMATTQIEYGLTTEYGTVVTVSTAASDNKHTARLTDLNHSTGYHFRIRGTTADGDDIYSQDQTLATITFPEVTAYVLKTDQNAGGTVISLAWASNVPTTSVVEYQMATIKATAGEESLTSEQLSKMSQDDLAKISVITKGEAQQLSKAALESTHLMRIEKLEDGVIYIIRLRGRDTYGNEAVSDPIRYVTGKDTRPPVISNVAVESQVTGSGKTASSQILVSWDTDEPATTQVLYGQGVGSEYPLATPEEKGLTLRHTVVIRDVAANTSYHLQIVSLDESGNQAKTGDLIAVTPAASDSALDVVLANLEDVFGFLKL